MKPAAFLSYVHADDENEEGAITKLREKLEGEVRMQTGDREFKIFQDRNNIGWGQAWRERIVDALGEASFLIVVLTPSWFTSAACREELTLFLEIEQQRKRNDLVLPILYMDCPVLKDAARRERDELATKLAERQYFDWRSLRFQPWSTPELRRQLAVMGEALREAMERAPRRELSPAPPVALNTGAEQQSSTSPVPSARAQDALTRLLLAMFSADELRRLITFLPNGDTLSKLLPGVTVSPTQLAHEAVIVLTRHGVIDPEFFKRLADERPRRVAEIRQVALLWGLP
ncbi:toll/interleukin-1 receptor domain-containing protein [Nannocystis punicea]|uniref:Toll/interleukin-1 receptor domain-containing protein n=1 Tax=Nannocystis punicea TaxID=2995304 RepID=A0ABY7H2V0_9BACT|nr:toll/interleukin-1 receptor domain-containing protein [Nannocystis poenicansa]WAS93601.1 toll/interleukin-1 receptor domain-containing protein [Nannocystis poenicansa]